MAIGIIIMLFMLIGICGILTNVFIMLAVGEDARAIGVKNRELWMLLAFFIPISALLYIVLRNSLSKTVPKMCTRCQATCPPNSTYCSNCGSTVLMDYTITDAEVHKAKRKNYIVGLVSVMIVSVVMSIIAVGAGVMFAFKNDSFKEQFDNGSGVYDFGENPFDFDENPFNNFDGGTTQQNDDDDPGKDFNNFGNGN